MASAEIVWRNPAEEVGLRRLSRTEDGAAKKAEGSGMGKGIASGKDALEERSGWTEHG